MLANIKINAEQVALKNYAALLFNIHQVDIENQD
jgi:hypothetical protein